MKAGFCLAILWLYSAAAFGAEIQGRVVNAQGAAVGGAKVTVTAPQDGARWEATTSPDGTYSVSAATLPPGVYTVTVSGPSGLGTLRREVAVGGDAGPVRADFQFAAAAAQTGAAVEERNPNIFIYRIDLNDLRNRLTIARGPDPQYVAELLPEQNYFGAEFGGTLQSFELVRPRALFGAWRGSLTGSHQNSALNARNFFNVGPLRPSRVSSYGATASGPLVREKASLLLQFGQSFTSGAVNGNILAPLPTERIPLSPDPRVNAFVANLLNAYPAEFPNLKNGQLNSNAPRDIDTSDALARLDLKPADNTPIALRYFISDYSEEPFQLVAGQNPQTELRTQGAYASATHTFSPQTVSRVGFHFDRIRALLRPTRRFTDLFAPLGIAAAPDIDFASDAFTDIGAGTQFPRFRVQNRFQLYADLSRTLGRHTLKAGWSSARVQVNDLQSDNSRGALRFSTDFGRSELDNIRLGAPSLLTITVGNLYRGFRNWEHSLFFEDRIRVTATLNVSVGLRYELMTAPTEVNHLSEVGFPTDKTNFSPRVGVAWKPGNGNTTLRAAYGMSYSPIFPVTYGMTRFNPPATQTIVVAQPDVLNLLAGIPAQPVAGGRSSLFQISPDFVIPYSHLYTLGIERPLPGAATVRVAYIGMRSFHLLAQGVSNRARPSSTIPNTTATVNQRRPDPRYYELNVIESISNAYYDAAQVSVDKRLSHGLTLRAAYTFGKNIDTGADFTNTATGVERPPETGIPPSELEDRNGDLKSLSLFDTTNALSLSYSYSLPSPFKTDGWPAALFRGWQISGTTIFQSGTPFHEHSGSDGPGIGNVDGVSHDRPNLLDPSILGKSLDDPDTSAEILGADTCTPPSPTRGFFQCRYFDTNVPVGGRGNIGYNVFRKDGTNNWNFAIGRTFQFPGGRERSVQFRAEFFNLFNHAQFEKPGVQLANRTFGQITNTVNKGRQVQFSLRLNF